jgi:hypothetical protein
LSSNCIRSIHGLEDLHDLEILILNNNEIQRTEGLASNFKITELHLAANKIKKVSNLEHLVDLECLDLRNNNISTLDALRPLAFNKQLRRLYLDGNPVVEKFHGTALANLLPQVTHLDNKELAYLMSSRSKLKKKVVVEEVAPISLTEEERKAARQRLTQTKKVEPQKKNPKAYTLSPEDRKVARQRLLQPKSQEVPH